MQLNYDLRQIDAKKNPIDLHKSIINLSNFKRYFRTQKTRKVMYSIKLNTLIIFVTQLSDNSCQIYIQNIDIADKNVIWILIRR